MQRKPIAQKYGPALLPVALAGILIAGVFTAQTAWAQQTASAPPASRSGEFLFTANHGQIVDTDGQARPDVLYYGGSGGVRLYCRMAELSYVFRGAPAGGAATQSTYPPAMALYRMDVRFPGANRQPALSAAHKGHLPHKHFYTARHPRGIRNVPVVASLRYRELYPATDLLLYGKAGRLKYDFIVKPGGNPQAIRMAYTGAHHIAIQADGSLLVRNPLGELREEAPYAYVLRNGVACEIPAQFVLREEGVGFQLGQYRSSDTLVIDPGVVWATFFGGSGEETGTDIAVESGGNSYIVGYTLSDNFPTTAGAVQSIRAGNYDATLAKYNSQGMRLWSTYYGGGTEDRGLSLALDPSGNVVMCGATASDDLPISPGALQDELLGPEDAFIARFSSGGSLLWATYFGGNSTESSDGIATDGLGNIILSGITRSNDFPVSAGAFQTTLRGSQDAFVARFTSNGALDWCTYLGGTGTGTDEDVCNGVATDSNNDILVVGLSKTGNFPTTQGAFQTVNAGNFDIFLTKFSAAGDTLWSTYFGGESLDLGADVAVDADDNVLITGQTSSNGFPITPGAIRSQQEQTEAFVAKFSPDGTLQWSTYFGGSFTDKGFGISTGPNNAVFITGVTASKNMLLSNETIQDFQAGVEDIYVAKITAAGGLLWSTYYGGSKLDKGASIGADAAGNAYLTGNTFSEDYPVTPNADQKRLAGNADAFIMKISDCNAPEPEVLGSRVFCLGDSVKLQVAGTYDAYIWSNGETLSEIWVKEPGIYRVTVTAPGGGCNGISDTVDVRANPRPDVNIQSNGQPIFCVGDSLTLDAGAGWQSYRWDNGSHGRFLTVRRSGIYIVNVTNEFGCAAADTLEVHTRPLPKADAGIEQTICMGDSITLHGSGGERANWSGPGGFSCEDCASVSVQPPLLGLNRYILTTFNELGCKAYDSVLIRVEPAPELEISAQSTVVCAGETVQLDTRGSAVIYNWRASNTQGELSCNDCPNPVARPAVTTTYTLRAGNERGCIAERSLTITVRERPEVHAAQQNWDFGELDGCNPDTVLNIVLYNPGNEAVGIGAPELNNPAFVWESGAGNFTIGARDSVTVRVRFRPQRRGTETAQLLLRGNLPCSFEYVLNLSGKRLSADVSTAPEGTIELGTHFVCETLALRGSITITNEGGNTLILSRPLLEEPFETVNADFPIEIEPGRDTTVQIQFLAAAAGRYRDTIRIPYSSGTCNDTLRLPLEGRAVDPALDAAVTELVFPELTTCEPYRDTTIVIENPGEFALELDTLAALHTRVQSLLPRSIAPAGRDTLHIRFAPVAGGAISETLRFFYGPCRRLIEIAIRGHKSALAFQHPDTLDLGEIVLCREQSTSAVVVINNASDNGIIGVVSSRSISPAFTTDLDPGYELQQGANTIRVEWRPDGPGRIHGRLNFTLDPCELQRSIVLIGNALLQESTPLHNVHFGNVATGADSDTTVHILNTGTAPLYIAALDPLPAPFSIRATRPGLPAVLVPGDTLQIDLHFRAVNAGEYTTALRANIERPCAVLLEATLSATALDMNVQATVALADVTAMLDETGVAIPVILRAAEGLANLGPLQFHARIKLNASIYLPQGPHKGSIAGNTRNGGTRYLQLSSPPDIVPQVGDSLLIVRGDVLLGDTDYSAIEFDSTWWTGAGIATTAINGSLRVEGHCEEGGTRLISTAGAMGIVSLSPNPAAHGITLGLRTLGREAVSLEIFSLAGACVYRTEWTPQPRQGYAESSVRTIATDFPPGTYYIVLRSRTQQDARRLLIIR